MGLRASTHQSAPCPCRNTSPRTILSPSTTGLRLTKAEVSVRAKISLLPITQGPKPGLGCLPLFCCDARCTKYSKLDDARPRRPPPSFRAPRVNDQRLCTDHSCGVRIFVPIRCLHLNSSIIDRDVGAGAQHCMPRDRPFCSNHQPLALVCETGSSSGGLR